VLRTRRLFEKEKELKMKGANIMKNFELASISKARAR
jgi:hypothetical protein